MPRQYRLYQQYTAPVLVPVVAAIALDWLVPLSEPIRYDKLLGAEYQPSFQGSAQVPAPPTVFQTALSLPVWSKSGESARQQFFTMDGRWSAPAAVTATYNWFNTLSEPVQIEPGLTAAWHQFLAVPSVPTVAVTDLRNFWFNPLSGPPKVKTSLRAPAQQFFAIDTNWNAPAPPTPRADSWYRLLSEPVRSKKAVAWQQPFATDWKWTAPTPAAVTDLRNGWYLGLTEPVRVQPSVTGASWLQSVSKENLDLRNFWYVPFSEPVRAKARVAWQQSFATDWKWQAPPTFTDLRNYWFRWLSEPVRVKAALHSSRQQFLTIDWKFTAPAPRADSWFKGFSEPVRKKGAVAYQLPFTTDWKWQAPPAFTDLRNYWFRPFSEPVRAKARVAWQQPYTTDWKWAAPAPRVDSWHRLLSEPVRSKRAVPFQQPYTVDWKWTAPPAFTDLRNYWFRPLSEPVRAKSALRAALQSSFATDWKWTAPPAVTVNFWLSGLSEPVRIQPSLVGSSWLKGVSQAAPPVPVSYSLSAVETGDGANLNVTVSVIYEIFLGANVTISEIKADTAKVAIIEVPY